MTASNKFPAPLFWNTGSYGFVRAEDGLGVYVAGHDPTPAVTFVFDRGEIWSIDTAMIDAGQRSIPLCEDLLVHSLADYIALMSNLAIPPPYRWIAGVEGVRGKGIFVSGTDGRLASQCKGSCVADAVVAEGTVSQVDNPKSAIRPFFEKVYDKCGLSRPAPLG